MSLGLTNNRRSILFDWGDTLMVDIPGVHGKMCDWGHVEAVPYARELLEAVSPGASIYIATAAAQSTPDDIMKAFRRVGLDSYLDGYFCKQNTGFTKPALDFYRTILEILAIPAAQVTMVGDNLENDILPCLQLGIKAIWLSANPGNAAPEGVLVARNLLQLEKILSSA